MQKILDQYDTQTQCYGIYARHAENARKTFPALEGEVGWFDTYDNTEQKFIVGAASVGGAAGVIGTVGFLKVHIFSSAAAKPV